MFNNKFPALQNLHFKNQRKKFPRKKIFENLIHITAQNQNLQIVKNKAFSFDQNNDIKARDFF